MPASAADPPIPDPEETSTDANTWPIGTAVSLVHRPTYLKTADPLPMLRPPDLVGLGEVGEVVEQRPLGQVAVRFRRGTFLLAAASCASIQPD
jgi:hypothetical protein